MHIQGSFWPDENSLTLNCRRASQQVRKSMQTLQDVPAVQSATGSPLRRGERYATFFGPVAAICGFYVPKTCADRAQYVCNLCAGAHTALKFRLSSPVFLTFAQSGSAVQIGTLIQTGSLA
jgi:hypothetical protein